jgi:hypothetical protein
MTMHRNLRLIPPKLGFDEASYYPRGPGWVSTEQMRPFNPSIWQQTPGPGPTLNAADRFNNFLGWSEAKTPIISNWMPGLGDPLVTNYKQAAFGDMNPMQLLGDLESKGNKLEMAIKAILVLSGIAAGTGILNLLRRR